MRTAICGGFRDFDGEDWNLLAALWTRGWITLSQLAAAWRRAAGERVTIRAVLLDECLVTQEQLAETKQGHVPVDPHLLRQAVRETAAHPELVSVTVLLLLRQRAGDAPLDPTGCLQQEGLTNEWAVLAAKALLRPTHTVDLTVTEPDAAALQLIPGSVAREHQALPLRVSERNGKPVLVVAVGDPDCIRAVDAVRNSARIMVQPVLADADALAAALGRHYPDA